MNVTAEHERKLDAPDGFELPDLGGSPLEPRIFTSVYYDVPGSSLTRSGITLRRRTEDGRSVWQLKLPPAGEVRLELEQAGGPAGPPDDLRDLLAAHVRGAAFEAIAELRTQRRGALVTRSGATAEVTIDEVAVMDGLRMTQEFVEVEIELLSGGVAQLDEIAGEVTRAGARPSDGTAKVFRALGPAPTRVSDPAGPFEALRAALRSQLGQILRHDPGTRLGRDPESLHDMRVAVRRSRALLRAGRKLIASDVGVLRSELQWLGGVLGTVRDLDVLIARLEGEVEALDAVDARGAGRLVRTLERERKRERRAMLEALTGARYFALLDRFEHDVEALRPATAPATLVSLARSDLESLGRAVEALPEDPSDDELHAVRKLGKRARYAAELAGERAIVKSAARLQDVLGDHHDAVVAEARLRALSLDAKPATALAAGRLVEREHARQLTARAGWPAAWQKVERSAR